MNRMRRYAFLLAFRGLNLDSLALSEITNLQEHRCLSGYDLHLYEKDPLEFIQLNRALKKVSARLEAGNLSKQAVDKLRKTIQKLNVRYTQLCERHKFEHIHFEKLALREQ